MAYTAKSAAERFWPKVDVRGPEECWEWLAAKRAWGYGAFGIFENGRTRMLAAHRVAWQLRHGKPIPRELHACHTCDNPGCVNPDHLWLGTDKENLDDMSRKRRGRGQGITHCKNGHEFTPENTITRKEGLSRRLCRECNRQAARRYYHRTNTQVAA